MEVDELIPVGEFYSISCPYCHSLDVAKIYYKEMPLKGSMKIKCYECEKIFIIKPKYGFMGFYTYREDK